MARACSFASSLRHPTSLGPLVNAQSTWLIIVWLEVRVLPAPPHSPSRTEIFLPFVETPGIGAVVCIDLSLQTSDRTSEIFCIRLSLAAKSRFPAGETDLNGDLVRLRHLLRRKAKHLVLPGPLQGKVGRTTTATERRPEGDKSEERNDSGGN